MEPKNKKDRRVIDMGLMPPQAVDLEEAVLGAVMLETDALFNIAEYFKPEIFYKDQHAKLAECIVQMYAMSKPINIMTVTLEMKKRGELEAIGGAYYITQLTNRVASSANIEYNVRILLQMSIKRKMIEAGTHMIATGYDISTDVFQDIDTAEQAITELTGKIVFGKVSSTATLYNKFVQRNAIIRESKDGLSGVPSGWIEMDKVIGGWQNTDLIILAGRPGMGKTGFALTLARNAAVRFKKPTAVFSLEMSEDQLFSRLMAQETTTNSQKFTRYGLSDSELNANELSCQALINSSLYIDDTPSLTLFELRQKARKLLRDHGIKVLIVDYLQLMKSGEKTQNKEAEVSKISGGLKALAKELGIPVIALSQLSRAVETRGGSKEPVLSDLRDSGSIEQDADLVIFIHRDEYYGINEDKGGNSTHGKAVAIIAKHRNGATDDIILNFEHKTTRFYDDSTPYQSAPELRANDKFLNEGAQIHL